MHLENLIYSTDDVTKTHIDAVFTLTLVRPLGSDRLKREADEKWDQLASSPAWSPSAQGMQRALSNESVPLARSQEARDSIKSTSSKYAHRPRGDPMLHENK